MKADFHFHSIYSDGVFTPTEVVELLKERKVKYASLSDHDSIDGCCEFLTCCESANIHGLVDVELSTRRANESVHIHGYFASLDKVGDELKEHLKLMEKLRYERLKAYTKNINELYNLNLDFEEISRGQHNLERPHLARALAKELNITEHECFAKYLGENCPGYIPSTKLSTEDGIALLRRNGAFIVLAHPHLLKKNDPEDIINYGIDGLECLYFPEDPKTYPRYVKLAKKHNLVITGGSDFHKWNDKKHSDIACKSIPGRYVKKFIKAVEEKH